MRVNPFLLVAVAVPVVLSSQSAPPVDLSGAWRLNTLLTDAPEQIDASIRSDLGVRDDAAFGASGRDFGGRGGGRRGRQEPNPANGTPRGNGAQAQESRGPSSDEQQMLDMTAMVRLPTPSLTVSGNASMVTLTDAQGNARTFHANGKDETQTYGPATLRSNARWEGPQLVIDFDLTKGRSMTFTYSIVPTSKQLLVRIAVARGPRDVGSFQIKHVYDKSG